jgi:hypothetical protein
MKYAGYIKDTTLKQVFDGYIEDTITEEQVQRVLAPVLRLIRDGAFGRSRWFPGRGSGGKAWPAKHFFRDIYKRM